MPPSSLTSEEPEVVILSSRTGLSGTTPASGTVLAAKMTGAEQDLMILEGEAVSSLPGAACLFSCSKMRISSIDSSDRKILGRQKSPTSVSVTLSESLSVVSSVTEEESSFSSFSSASSFSSCIIILKSHTFSSMGNISG
jgi:hypothetical protein